VMAVIKVLRKADAFVGMILYQKDQNQDQATRASPVKDDLFFPCNLCNPITDPPKCHQLQGQRYEETG